MYYLVENGPLRWPTIEKHGFELSTDSKDLIDKLLNKNKDKRLGKEKDFDEIISHPWFSDIDINKLMRKEITPPYIPTVKT
jgi:serine/threonine protein kinase